MLNGIKKLVAIWAVFAVIEIGIHASSHNLSAHRTDSCVLCIAASLVIPVNNVIVQSTDPTILFNVVPVTDILVKTTFYNTVLSRGPPYFKH
ncbi:MAG TPA: hypothetical protein DCL44_07400 [Elusimicrobia bacterium]|nr:hypothetical protein [Elusimicrobiota bacterium]